MTKIVFAEHENVDLLKEYTDLIFEEMGLKGLPFITDETLLWDFGPSPEILKKLTTLVGFPVKKEDYLVDICTRWRNRVDTSIA